MKQFFSIMPHSKKRIAIGMLLIAGAIRAFFANVRYSIQFTGGIEMVLDAPSINQEVKTTLETALIDKGYTDVAVNLWKKDENASILIQLALQNDEQVGAITTMLEETLTKAQVIETPDDILELSIIWPSIGSYIKKSAKVALIAGSVLMGIYILFAFAAMRYLVAPTRLAVITVITMIFDVWVPAGAYGIAMWLNPALQVDSLFVIALLTIMGYSVNDTIIIFDRVRENYLQKQSQLEKGKVTTMEIFETSLWQVMRRSLGTGLSTFIVIIAMYIFGTAMLKSFAFTLGIGIIAGTYSSIFLAAPIAGLFATKKHVHHPA